MRYKKLSIKNYIVFFSIKKIRWLTLKVSCMACETGIEFYSVYINLA